MTQPLKMTIEDTGCGVIVNGNVYRLWQTTDLNGNVMLVLNYSVIVDGASARPAPAPVSRYIHLTEGMLASYPTPALLLDHIRSESKKP